MGIVIFVLGIVLFLGLIITHEMGHFIVARRNGVKAEEFGIFFPPRLWKKRMKGGWDFTVNLLPLGGFVKLKGEHDSDTEPGTFGAASDWAKAKIMLAGVAVNLVTALLLFTVLALIGMPKLPLPEKQFTIASDTKISRQEVLVGYVTASSPAEKAGLKQNDKLVSITKSPLCQPGPSCTTSVKNVPIKTADDLLATTKKYAGQNVYVNFYRQGVYYSKTATLRTSTEVESSKKTNSPKGYLGVAPQEITLQRSTWSAPVVAAGLSVQLTKLTLQGIGHALQGLGGIIAGGLTGNTTARQNAQTEASSQVSGPLGIYFVLKDGSALGWVYMLFIIAIISLTLAIMNVLPVPALDGGRLYLMLASRLTKAKRLTPRAEESIVGISFMVLIGLIVLITIVDVKRFF